MGAKVFFLGAVVAVALTLSVFLFGMPLWVPIILSLTTAALVMRGYAVAAFMFGMLILGGYFALALFGLPPDWIFALVGVVAIIVIGIHMATPSQGGVSSNMGTGGDQNPIPMLLTTIGIRAWLFAFNATGSALTDDALNPLTWITIIVFGVVPSFPLLVNILLFIATNGSLILWLVLLNKRIVSPFAN